MQFVVDDNFNGIGVYKIDSPIIHAGHTEEIADTLRKESTWNNGIIATINYLITLQSEKHKKEVGGDIDIIKITKDSTYWPQRKQACY